MIFRFLVNFELPGFLLLALHAEHNAERTVGGMVRVTLERSDAQPAPSHVRDARWPAPSHVRDARRSTGRARGHIHLDAVISGRKWRVLQNAAAEKRA